jgi:glycosyltransferase involved in cell wall biosynthesis
MGLRRMKTRILFIITGLSTGGAEMMLLKLLERLSRERFSASVISLTNAGELAPRIETLGIPVEAVGFKPGFFSPLAFLRLTAMIRKMKPDIVHTWLYHADLLGGLAARLARVRKVIWCIRNSDLSRERTRVLTRWVMHSCARLSPFVPHHIVSCSETALRIHAALGYRTEKMSVIPNGFDLDRFKPDAQARRRIRVELGISEETPLVGLIGRFDPQKNHAGFFEAAGSLLKRFPETRFLLAGSGIHAHNPALAEAMERNHVTARTHLLGLRTDIPDIMAALDILASSSYGEAFLNVLGEAMASNVPCAVTDVGDSAFIVGDTGSVVASGDMAGLADALARLLALPPPERADLGRRARKRIEKHFEIASVCRRYEDFYESL